MALREDRIGQTWLMPKRLTDFIPENHICYFIANLVEELDFKEIDRKYRYTRGKAAYSRRMLLRVVIMASVDGVFSSRQINKHTEENMVYMYLSGMDKPDFRTICRFKIECAEQIEEAFKMTVNVAKNTGLVQLNHIAIDGTKIKANASSTNLINQEEIKTIREILKKGIQTDENEDKIYGDQRGDEVPAELVSRKKVHEIIQRVRKENKDSSNENNLRKSSYKLLEQALANKKKKNIVSEKLDRAEEQLKKTAQETVSLTDPESRWMKNKKNQMEFSYNMQIAVDYDSGIILASSITQDPTDHHQLIPQIEQIRETLELLPDDTKISADNGYYTRENLQYLEENRLDGYIPNRKQVYETKPKLKKAKPFSKHNFSYDYDYDQYICPNNKKLAYQKTYKYKDAHMRQYYCNDCLKCCDQLECVGKDRLRVITDYGGVLSKRMALKMETPEGKYEFSKRKQAVEWPFGNIKENLKFTEFFTRGIRQTQTEKNLLSISHNLKRIHNEKQNETEINNQINT
ncbi:MAG: IS1182 family transposase [Candidatus Thermoplasmatota archaeon]|nr:IS1182 family transposase [Candidatus Thermoplasmatota archaeon]